MIATLIGVAILTLAAVILIRRAGRFIRTRGRSGCANCPYSRGCCGGCSGGCDRDIANS
ncbi:MAG: hypothetical protein ACI4MF_05160 [Candidatus Faecivicinus sp.]